MADFDNNRFASKNQEYETPEELFNKVNNLYHFNFDVCADDNNHKCDRYFTEKDDALTKTWYGNCWMNPPYKDMKKWVIKAYEESRKDECLVCCLIPARTNTKWWHEYCMNGEILFIKGRPKFKGCIHGLPQPLALVIFANNIQGNYEGFSLV